MVEGGEADQKFSAGASSAPSNIAPVPEYETTDAFVKRCCHIESLRRRRIVRPRFQRLPNVSDHWYISSSGRSFKRLCRKYRTTDYETEKLHDIASVIQEEVMEALEPITDERRDKTTAQRSVPTRPQARRETTNRPPSQRRTDLWRTDNNVPFCYHFGRPGHVLRCCRERRRIFQNARATRTINPRRDVYADSLAGFDDAEEARQLAKLHIREAQVTDKRRYDERHRPVSYNIRGLVWVFTPVRKVGFFLRS
ncbi:hypothetical protein HNY73_006174 [Argiope bruennichi]|uniref:Uncharacterized protein n=1 Tax=Argiope bruennichi TaxID=94029 RepID=A0A8T0FK22_ARGBR|nr:hypothetical protein HNY73_006174 [Argiope bruennichi]